MSGKAILVMCSLSVALFAPACGKKKKIVTNVERLSTVDTRLNVDARLIMSENLSPKLKEAGLTDEQAEAIVKKGKAKPAETTMNLTADTVLAEVKAFTAGATEALNEIGELPATKTKAQILKVITGSNIKILKELRVKIPDLNLRRSASAIVGAASASIDDAGFSKEAMTEAMREISASLTENADDAGIQHDEVAVLLEDSLKVVMDSFKEIETIDMTSYDDLMRDLSIGFMAGFKSFDGFTKEMCSDASKTIGRTVMESSESLFGAPNDNTVLLNDMMRAVTSGVFTGAVEFTGADAAFYEMITESVSSATIEGIMNYESLDQGLLDSLRKESIMGIQEAVTSLETTNPEFDSDLKTTLIASTETATGEVITTSDLSFDYDKTTWEGIYTQLNQTAVDTSDTESGTTATGGTGGTLTYPILNGTDAVYSNYTNVQ